MLQNKEYIRKLQIIETDKKLNISGLLVRGNYKPVNVRDNTFSTFKKIIGSYFDPVLNNHKIIIHAAGKQLDLNTDENGEFFAETPKLQKDKIFFTSGNSEQPLQVLQNYPVYFQKNKGRFLIVSDIDDTVLISNSAQFFSKLRLMLFKSASKRRLVKPTQIAYKQLDTDSVSFAYVSGSENNLFHLLGAIFMKNKLPKGPLFLRPHMFWKDLLKAKKREEYKLNRIIKLITLYPEKRLILFGDDSQQDYDVFTKLSKDYPQVIHSIFLRRTGITKRFKNMPVKTQTASGNSVVYYYNEFEEIKSAVKEITEEIRAQ